MKLEKQNKYYWWIFLIAVIAITTPLVINRAIIQPQKIKVVGDGTQWLGFWGTYISAIASFAMVIITWKTLKQNKEQLSELKRQWDEKKRARLSFSIIPSQSWYELKISNIGYEPAYNIKIIFNNNFIDNIPIPKAKEIFRKFQENAFSIEQGKSKYLLIGVCDGAMEYWKDKCEDIIIKGSYCGLYSIDEKVNILEYTIGGSVVDDELTTAFKYFKKGVIVQNDSYYPIQKSLDIIAKKIDKINFDK